MKLRAALLSSSAVISLGFATLALCLYYYPRLPAEAHAPLVAVIRVGAILSIALVSCVLFATKRNVDVWHVIVACVGILLAVVSLYLGPVMG